MATSILVERSTFASAQTGSAPAPATAPATNWCAVPRCELRVEKCKDGVKLHCSCEEEIACATLQNLCRSLAGGQCSVTCQWNGITVFDCKLVCGNCKIECTEEGCCISCCSGDQACCEITQACCEALACCLKNGCCCFVCISGTPICCCC
ncbi:hypothetical protein SH661x_001999 [Planctomicrobium sp. SH661]|uniref:hypothetical protein n=1 Tax=Planctomicrobium sp. SH661 TaxID=3448124 RepID=UPI003F5C034C